MNLQCIKCKGRGFCGRKFCAIASKISTQKKINSKAKQDFYGSSPNVFIGRYGYPEVNVGILSTEDYNYHDDPLVWSEKNYNVSDVIDRRIELINSGFAANIKSFNDRFLEISKEVSLSKKPVGVEINLNKKPFFNINFNQDTMPHGPRVKLKKAKITENTKIPSNVERIVSDSDLKAASAISLLRRNYDNYYLTKIFSVGNLGLKTERKLVPTRWSITAVDDILGKELISEIRDYPESDYLAFFGGYLGNYYLVLMFPRCWSYELFETLVGTDSSFSTDFEGYDSRKEYADNTAGGYYAARLAILERLSKMKRQSSILALRFITDEYWAPLGVWVVREAVRKAMNSKPIGFDSKELILRYAELFAKKRFNFDIGSIIKNSRLLDIINKQKTLASFNN